MYSDNPYAGFYNDLFLQTNGFIPAWPFGEVFQIGDLLMIEGGKMILIGNITDPYFGITESIDQRQDSRFLEPEIKIYTPIQQQWQCESGVHYSYKSKGSVYEVDGFIFAEDKRGLMINYSNRGSYLFRCKGAKYASFDNFNDLAFKILQRLTSESFSFRELYLITDVAEVEEYALTIASAPQAQLVVSLLEDTHLTLDDLSDTRRKFEIENTRNMETVRLREKGAPFFFRANKMTLSIKGERMISKFIEEQLPERFKPYLSNIRNYAGVNILPSKMIYPTSVHDLFHFRKMNLNDLSQFFDS